MRKGMCLQPRLDGTAVERVQLNYDQRQDLVEQHRALRHVMGVGDWDEETNFGWRRIRDNVCLLQSATIERISHWVVSAGHRLLPPAARPPRGSGLRHWRCRSPPEQSRVGSSDHLRTCVPSP